MGRRVITPLAGRESLALALTAATAIIAGLAIGLLELTILGIVAAAVTAALWLSGRSA